MKREFQLPGSNTCTSIILLLLLLFMGACGAAGGGDGTTPDEDEPLPIGTVFFGNPASDQLSSLVPEAAVTLQAYVRDTNNTLMPGVVVQFAADNNGTLLIVRGTTDASGSAEVTLTSPDDNSNRTITVTATAGTGSNAVSTSIDIEVTDSAPPAVTDPQVTSILLTASTPQLPSANLEAVTITAFVRDQANNIMPGITVVFAADNDGTLQVTRATTDASGTAQALLSTPGNKTNREIKVTASAAGITEEITVRVTGTELTITGPNSAMLGNTVNLDLTLRDSAGVGIGGTALTAHSAAGNTFGGSLTTGAVSGATTITVNVSEPATGGTDTITISGAGATATHTINVTTDSFTFTTPAPEAELALNANHSITLVWQSGGAAISGQNINFSSTRGILSANSVNTNATGEASVTINADNAGWATITATSATGLSARLDLLFVATTPASMTLQAHATVIGTNSADDDSQQSEIIAVVRDANNNLVKNQTINFSLSDVTGGTIQPSSAVTDAFGRARATYTAGTSASSHEGIEVSALVVGSAISNTVKLTTAQQPLFITLGTGNVLGAPDTTRYSLPYGVLVTDSAGGPMADTEVTLSIWPTNYYKGYFLWDTGISKWLPLVTAGACPNEDVNRDGILDPGEDYNDNELLDPGNIATLSSTTVTTNSEGYAEFNVLYFQQHAFWTEVELTARTLVSGSESRETAYFTLPILASHLTSEAGPAGNPSPFGTSTSCDDDLVLTASPLNVTSDSNVTLTLLKTPAGPAVAGVPITVAVTYLTRPGDWTVTATTGSTNADGVWVSNVTITSGQSGDEARIIYQAGGAQRVVTVMIP